MLFCFHVISMHLTFLILQIAGVDDEGFDFQRITPTAISAIQPYPPKIDMAARTRGYYDKTAIVHCNVESMVPFTVQWHREGEKLGTVLYYR